MSLCATLSGEVEEDYRTCTMWGDIIFGEIFFWMDGMFIVYGDDYIGMDIGWLGWWLAGSYVR